ncbi:MAG: Hsp70 family protein, partial [Planctomycetota bacterium]|nr:Hsp70 family protein [Planctomycetota bacterium]
MGLAIGIDLGVHYSTVAFLDGSRPNVLENRENRTRTRSVVSLKKRKGSAEPEILVGDAALDNWAVAPKDTIIAVRRLLGRSFSDPEVQKVRRHYMYEVVQGGAGAEDTVRVKMGGKEYSPTDIAALILKKLKADAEFRLGKPVTHAAITV